ncbi:hypothetical protein ACOI22_06570 [Glaciecola sp. 2405UD65-10]|uniref:hypothetical protein n=1 Tax=Glaciecola sp. 2405UD65-10 TaxID=3397244 RepID=UPI003B5BFCC2
MYRSENYFAVARLMRVFVLLVMGVLLFTALAYASSENTNANGANATVSSLNTQSNVQDVSVLGSATINRETEVA